MSPGSDKLVIAAIDFVNPAPLMWDFEHEPASIELATRYKIISSTPAQCAQRLATGAADIGLVPVAAYASAVGQSIIPGCTIASLTDIRSIILVIRAGIGMHEVRSVALDTASLTSATYTRILFQKRWNVFPEFRPQAADLEAMLATAEAALLIGDPALLALENKEKREARTGERLTYIDLGHEWRAWTGTPWVSAFWAVRDAAVVPNTASREQIIEDFQHSRDHGLQHIEDLVSEWSTRIAVSPATLRTYLTHNIHYVLDDACLEGLQLFYRYAEECRALAAIPQLKFL